MVLPRLVLAGFGLIAALDAVSIGYTLSYHDLIQRVIDGGDFTIAEVSAADDRQNVLEWIQIALFLGVGVVFIVWLRAAYGNLQRLGVSRLRWRRRWAVIAWLIPIANLFLPKRLANDIWRGSDPGRPAEWALRPDASVPWFYLAWWLLFVADGLFDRFAFQKWRDAQSLDSLSSASLTVAASYALDLLAVAFAAVVVYETAKRQRRRTEMVTAVVPADARCALSQG